MKISPNNGKNLTHPRPDLYISFHHERKLYFLLLPVKFLYVEFGCAISVFEVYSHCMHSKKFGMTKINIILSHKAPIDMLKF